MTKRHLARLLEEAEAKNEALRGRIDRLQASLEEANRLRRINEAAYDELREQMNDLLAKILASSAVPERRA